MKVLHIETGRNLYGGAQQVMFLLRNLPKYDVESHLFCDQGSSILKACEAEGFPTHAFPIAGDLDLSLPFKISKVCKSIQPDIIHVHSRRGVDYWGGWIAKRLDIPCVLSRRVDNPEPRWLAKTKYGMYSHVITISDGIRQVLISEGVPQQDITLVRSALELDSYPSPLPVKDFRNRFGIREDHKVIACAAQLIERKGHRFLLNALPEVLKQHPKIQVLLFGKGKELQSLQNQVSELNLHTMVQFPGFAEDIKSIYPHVDILVHPALMEGLGVALIEASYAGVPIIAARAGGIPEIVRDQKNGLLVPPGDSDAIRDAMIQLLGNPVFAKELGNYGRTLAKEEFSVDPMAAGNAQVYRSILNR